MTEQDIYGGYGQPHQPASFGRSSFSSSPYPDAVQNARGGVFQDPSSYRPVTTSEAVQQPMSGPIRRVQEDASHSGGDDVERLRGMLSQVTAELGKQVSAHHGESRGGDAARAEWLQKLVLQMEAKQVLADAELRDTRSKFSGLQLRLQGQEAENDALRENLSRAHRGQPQLEPAPSEEHTHMMLALKRENKACRSQIDDLTHRNEILQRSVQHFENQQHNMLGESSNLMLRLQGSEQRTDQLMKQKGALDDELHSLRSQLAAQQKQWGKSEREYKDQLQAMQQQRAQESQRAGEELKTLHMQLALQQEQFEKQRMLMAQQRDGVQKGFEEELSDVMDKQTKSLLKNQELETKIFQVNLKKWATQPCHDV
jgi:CII-binding regulator of phage lambda lysogenization HflD